MMRNCLIVGQRSLPILVKNLRSPAACYANNQFSFHQLCVTRTFASGKGPKKDKKRQQPKVTLSDDEMMKIIDVEEFKDDIDVIVNGLQEAYTKALNMRAGVGLEELEVEFDENIFPLKELATISRKAQNMLVLNMTDLPEAIKPVKEAIMKSGMNVNPQQEGTLLYIQLPRITREHRELLAKNAKTMFTKAKDELTKVQNVYVKKVNDIKIIKPEGLSDDLIFNTTENIRFRILAAIQKCESLLGQKTKELLGDDV